MIRCLAHHPHSPSLCGCVGLSTSCRFRRAVCVCVCLCLKGQCLKRRVLRIQLDPHRSGFELSFGILSFVRFVLGPPARSAPSPLLSFPSLPLSPPPSVCLLADEFVSLSGSSQTLRHLLPTDTQTDSEITSQWQRLGGRGRLGGLERGEVEETDVQTEPQQRGDGYLSHINHAGNTP